MRPYGGLIGKYRSASSLAANGMWVQNEHAMFKQNGAWPLNLDSDPYFNYTTLLLPGTGTNGANNNTFLDSSTNNFTVTRNGNTTQGTFSPFSQTGWSNYFDGSGDYLSVANTAALQLSNSTAWTVELWFYATALSSEKAIFNGFNPSGSPNYYGFGLNLGSNGQPATTLMMFDGTNWTNIATVSANQWYHVAVSYEGSGTTRRCFLNGVLQGSAGTVPSTITNTSTATAIGALSNGNFSFPGYISNVRVVKGTAVYTSNFTPPTSPLTAITNTSLLTCQSNRFVDNSGTPLTVTANGNTSVVPFSPFAPTQPYSASAVGGSGYFDGSGDFLSLANNAALALSWTFTIDFWFYTSTTATQRVFGKFTNAVGGYVLLISSTSIDWYNRNSAVTNAYLGGASTVPMNQWNHMIISQDTTRKSLWLNGTRLFTDTNLVETQDDGSTLLIGNYNGSLGGTFNGYISNFRIVKDYALYDLTQSTVSVPTAPLTAVTGTSLLLNFTNAGITDATGKNVIETAGDAQISTAQSKWGGGSMYFDGTGDWAITPTSPINDLSTGSWTIEFWIYPTTAAPAAQTIINLCTSASNYNGTHIWMNASRQLVVDNTQTNQSAFSGGTLTLNTWNHVAITRISTTTTGYINGSSVGTNNYTPNSNQAVCLGYLITIGYPFNGYLSDLRITKGYARYTTNFSPPIRLSSIK